MSAIAWMFTTRPPAVSMIVPSASSWIPSGAATSPSGITTTRAVPSISSPSHFTIVPSTKVASPKVTSSVATSVSTSAKTDLSVLITLSKFSLFIFLNLYGSKSNTPSTLKPFKIPSSLTLDQASSFSTFAAINQVPSATFSKPFGAKMPSSWSVIKDW